MSRWGPGPHLFVADLYRPQLDPADRHHVGRVLRRRAGDPVVLCDGAGRWRAGRLEAGGAVVPDGEVVTVGRPVPSITVGLAVVKGQRPDWAVQKLTEIGVDTIWPFHAGRSVVRWEGERTQRHHQRLARIAREAAMQSRRLWLPEVRPVSPFAEAGTGEGVALADRGGDPPTLTTPTVLVGPEGGWTDDERDGRPTVALGAGVLRTETAAVAAGVLLVALRERLVQAGGSTR